MCRGFQVTPTRRVPRGIVFVYPLLEQYDDDLEAEVVSLLIVAQLLVLVGYEGFDLSKGVVLVISTQGRDDIRHTCLVGVHVPPLLN